MSTQEECRSPIPPSRGNDILVRTLCSVDVPAMLEPPGLIRGDGKRIDGMTLVPWLGGIGQWFLTLHDRYTRPFARF